MTYLSLRRHTCSSTPRTVTPSSRPDMSIRSCCPFGEDGIVGGVPSDTERCGGPRRGQMVDTPSFRLPAKCLLGQTGARLCRDRQISATNMASLTALVAAQQNLESSEASSRRDVRELTDHGVAGVTRGSRSDSTSRPVRPKHSRMARSGSRGWPVTVRPHLSRLMNVVRSAGM